MLIPSIDVMNGRIVQLEQGERLKIATEDVAGWIDRLRPFPLVQVIDLDAAKRQGNNAALVRRLCRALPCRVGGGIRTPGDARARLADGARQFIVGSALFDHTGVSLEAASAFGAATAAGSFIPSVDAAAGRVVVAGWRATTAVTPIDAIRALEPYAAGFLYTDVDREGLLAGVDVERARELAAATARRLTVAGGVRSLAEVRALDALGIDAVVGMAIYTGRMPLDAAVPPR